MLHWFKTAVSCPISHREELLPVSTLDYRGEVYYCVNTCDNAPGDSPECAQCVLAAQRKLKDRELP